MGLGQETWEGNSSIAYDCDTHVGKQNGGRIE